MGRCRIKQKIKDFFTLPLRALTIFFEDRWGLSALATERFDYVSREVRGYCLDMHCGHRNRFVDEYLDGRGVGVDVFPGNGAGPHYRCEGLTALSFEDSTFDTVTFIASINHIPRSERDSEISEAYRCLRPGGNIVVTMGTPVAEVLVHKVVKLHNNVFGTEFDLEYPAGTEEREEYYLTDSEIIERLSRAGFSLFFKRHFLTQWGLNHLIVGWKAPPRWPQATLKADEPNQGLAIVPAFNEERNVGRGVRELLDLAFLDVLVVNDGSSDGTAEEAQLAGAVVISHPKNHGIGEAMRTGMSYALERGYQYAIQFDADGQHDPSQIYLLLTPLLAGDADVVIGSRFLGTEGYKPHWPRRIGTRLLAAVVREVTGLDATDTTSGFRAMNRRALAFLVNNYPKDYPESESMVLIYMGGIRWKEVPVTMRSRADGTSSIGNLASVYYMVKVLACIALDAIGLRGRRARRDRNSSP